MPELTDKPFRAKIVSPNIRLPSHPQLPDEVLKRFPSMRDYAEEQESWWSRTRKILSLSAEEQAFAFNNQNHGYLNMVETVGGNTAAIIAERIVRADEDAALALAIDALSASFDAGRRTIFAQPDAPDPDDVDLNDGDLWFDTDDGNKVYRWRAAGMEWEAMDDTRISGSAAAITVIQTTYATQLFAEAKKSEAILAAGTYTDTETAAVFSAITTAYTSADATIVSRVTDLESSVDTPGTGLLARISTVESTFATKTFAEAKRDEAITAAAGDATSKVGTEATARATADGHMSGKYTLKVVAGNVVTGMNITSSTGVGTDVSSVIFQATDFLIHNGTTGKTMFDVSSSAVRLGGVLTVDTDNNKVFIGDGNFGDADTAFFVNDAGDFSLKDKLIFVESTGALTINGSGTFTGTITATGGTFGGWVLSSTTLSNNNAILDSAGQLVLGTSNDVLVATAVDSTYRLWIGNATSGSAAFRVTKGGALTATGATITGAITATSGSFTGAVTATSGSFTGSITATGGTFGGWVLSSSTLSANDAILDSAGQLALGTSNDIIILSATDATYRIWCGNATAGSASFRVTKGGALTATGANITGAITATSGSFTGTITATSGTFGGWNLSSTTLSANNAVLDSAGQLGLGTSNDIIVLSSTDSTYRIWCGNATAGSASFRVTKGGLLIATGVNVTGVITATSGTFTGTVSASTISGSSITGTSTLDLGAGGNRILIDTTNGLRIGDSGGTGGFYATGSGTAATLSIGGGGSHPVTLAGGPGASVAVGLSGAGQVLIVPGSITINGDVNLYRAGAGILKTDDGFVALTGAFDTSVSVGVGSTVFTANTSEVYVEGVDFTIYNSSGTQKFAVAAASGNITTAGTLGVTGAATFSSTLAAGNTTVGTLTAGGDILLNASGDKFRVQASNGSVLIQNQLVITIPKTGWALPTGPVSRATFDASTATLQQGLERLAALITDCYSHHQLVKA